MGRKSPDADAAGGSGRAASDLRERARVAAARFAQSLDARARVRENQLPALSSDIVAMLMRVAVMRAAVEARLLEPPEATWAGLRRSFEHMRTRYGGRLFSAGRRQLGGRRVKDRDAVTLVAPFEGTPAFRWSEHDIEEVGWLYEHLIAHELARARDGQLEFRLGRGRKKSGSFFTPRAISERVVVATLESHWARIQKLPKPRRRSAALALRVCDPAMGAGAFLLETARQLAAGCAKVTGDADEPAKLTRVVVERCLYGLDLSPLAAAVAEASLWLLVANRRVTMTAVGEHLGCGHALVCEPKVSKAAFDWDRNMPEVMEVGGFDAIVGNPPWIAYAGRAAQPLPPTLRRHYRERYSVFSGYPTLHGLFVERATELAPSGTVGLVLPSPLADLDGYRPVRRAATRHHRVKQPLLEFGQDAFAGVVQPSFGLVLEPDPSVKPSDEPWRLTERQRAGASANEIDVPQVVELLLEAAPFPKELFREMGFQSAGSVSKTLFLRAPEPDSRHEYPLLEGKNVSEFVEGPPKLFLAVDREALRQARCRVRPQNEYQNVDFVVRQTAVYPIAAEHQGFPFRNTLLAGLAVDGLTAPLVVGLLNSALYRAMHVAATRDARQAAFPQVKLKHLRALPRPPSDPAARRRIEKIATRAKQKGLGSEQRLELDDVVFDLFRVPPDHRLAVTSFLGGRVPRLGYESATVTPRLSLDPVRRVVQG